MNETIGNPQISYEELESIRVRTRTFILVLNGLAYLLYACTLAMGVLVQFIFELGENGNLAMVVIVIIGGGISSLLLFVSKKKKKSYQVKFREVVIGNMIKNMDSSLNYIPNQYISYEQFADAKLFRQWPGRYQGENLITKQFDQFSANVSEIDVYQRSNKNSSSKKLFQGLYFVFYLHKYFEGETLILNDTTQGSFGFLGEFYDQLHYKNYQHLPFNNAEFEKYFQIYSTNPDETKRVVDTDLVELLLEIRKKMGSDTRASILKNTICISVATGKKHFNTNINKSVLDQQMIQLYVYDLQNIQSYIEQFAPIVERISH